MSFKFEQILSLRSWHFSPLSYYLYSKNLQWYFFVVFLWYWELESAHTDLKILFCWARAPELTKHFLIRISVSFNNVKMLQFQSCNLWLIDSSVHLIFYFYLFFVVLSSLFALLHFVPYKHSNCDHLYCKWFY